MANRTVRRQTFSVEADNDDFNIGYYNQASFKGINTNKNDVTADPTTFAAANNVYVDDNSVLVSRPPIKLWDKSPWIIKEWVFGEFEFRMQKLLVDDDDNIIYKPQQFIKEWKQNNPEATDLATDHMRYVFLLTCMSHDTISTELDDGSQAMENLAFAIPYTVLGNKDMEIAVSAAQIEDKIYFWVGGLYLYDFNCAGQLAEDGSRINYFEESTKYVYYPVHKLVINGIESDLETKNFLTETYRRRYQYSQLSSINFDTMIGKRVRVSLSGDMTQGQSTHLYDIEVGNQQKMALVYPYSDIGTDAVVDMVVTSRGNVFMRHNITTKGIEVSFDGKYFRSLPELKDVIGEPCLTRDGFWCIAFTKTGVARCQLVALTTEDVYEQTDYFSWTIVPYAQNNIKGGSQYSFNDVDISFTPRGYFDTIDNFAYVFRVPSTRADYTGGITCLYSEWLHGTDDKVWAFHEFLNTSEDGTVTDAFSDDDYKVAFKYVAPTLGHEDLGSAVSILHGASNSVTTIIFGKVEQEHREVRNGDRLSFSLTGDDSDIFFALMSYGNLQKLNTDLKTFNIADDIIHYGDPLTFTYSTRNVNIEPYSSTKTYKTGERCTLRRRNNNKTDYYIYTCIKEVRGISPSDDNSNTYWEAGGVMDTRQLFYNASGDTQFTDDTIPGSATNVYSSLIENYNGYLFNEFLFTFTKDGITNTPTTDPVMIGDKVILRRYGTDSSYTITYTPAELQELMGDFVRDTAGPSSIDMWTSFDSQPVRRELDGSTDITLQKFPFNVELTNATINPFEVKTIATVENTTNRNYSSSASRMDVQIASPLISEDNVKYYVYVAYVLSTSGRLEYVKHTYDSAEDTWSKESKVSFYSGNGTSARLYADNSVVLSAKGLWYVTDDDYVLFPNNGLLSENIEDEARLVINSDTISVSYTMKDTEDRDQLIEYIGNIHKTKDNYRHLSSDKITPNTLSGVAWVEDAITAEDYLTPDTVPSSGNASNGRYFVIGTPVAQIGPSGNPRWSYPVLDINPGRFVELAYTTDSVILQVGDPGNPTDRELTVTPMTYPAAPSDWQIGNPWPSGWGSIPKPFIPTGDNTYRLWQEGDELPTGAIKYYGTLNIKRTIQPLFVDASGVWILVNGQLWTSQPTSGNIVEVDEYINCDWDGDTMIPRMDYSPPTHAATLNEHFFSFVKDGKHLLEVTSSRRDEEKLFSDKGNDLLLYMPELNEQILANKITALHNLSDIAMGLFTEDAVYYVNAIEQESGGFLYSKPIKSKIPLGLRDGDEIITALDGQVFIFPTQRGLAAMAPEDFVATTERSISYLSDNMQDLYNDFYTNQTEVVGPKVDGNKVYYKNRLCLNTYRYWILLWRKFDRRIFALDTRSSTWWKWEMTYPLRLVFVTGRLHLGQNIAFNPYMSSDFNTDVRAPYLGWDCIFCDEEMNYDYVNDTSFPSLSEHSLSYEDAIIDGALNGDVTYSNNMQIVYYAEQRIKWHITSQKLIFDAPNNYKKIRQIIMNAKGTEPISTKLSTKVFRDLTHPEQSITMEIKINDLRTFVKYVNYMHVIDFQYKLENDVNDDTDNQLRLNMLSIKYEVKENIR